jgi:hypothetical protein
MKEDKVVYTFTYTDKSGPVEGFPLETHTAKTSVFESACTWDDVLKDFIRFLEGVYGYNISDQVEIYTAMQRFADEWQSKQDEKTDEDASNPT